MTISLFTLAQRFVGLKELPGESSNPMILAMLKLDAPWPEDDAVAWCSAFLNAMCWLLRLPRTKSLAARSWLAVGSLVTLDNAVPGYDVVILKRGPNGPGVEVMDAPGHVGLFAGLERGHISDYVLVLGGNQGDSVSVARFPTRDVLGVRRLAPPDPSVVAVA